MGNDGSGDARRFLPMHKATRIDAVGLWFAALLCACGPERSEDTTIRGDVLERHPNNAGDIIAVIARDASGNATVGYVWRVYMHGHRGPTEVLTAVKTEGITASWVAEDKLRIAMPCGQIQHFMNFYDQFDEHDVWTKRISIELLASGICPDSMHPDRQQ
jgi:hypothetical protein